jgi:hypothetical protein
MSFWRIFPGEPTINIYLLVLVIFKTEGNPPVVSINASSFTLISCALVAKVKKLLNI